VIVAGKPMSPSFSFRLLHIGCLLSDTAVVSFPVVFDTVPAAEAQLPVT
jgi:hypothetical protein